MKNLRNIILIVILLLIVVGLVVQLSHVLDLSENELFSTSMLSKKYNAKNLSVKEHEIELDIETLNLETNGHVIVEKDDTIDKPLLIYSELLDGNTSIFKLNVSDSLISHEKHNYYLDNFEDFPIWVKIPNSFPSLEATISMDYGILHIDSVDLHQGHLELDAGILEMNDLIMIDSSLDVDAGNIKIKDAQLSNVSLKMDAGNIDVSSIIHGNLVAKVSAGNIHLLTPNLSQINVNSKVNLGNIQIDGQSFEKSVNQTGTNGETTLDLKVDLGNIELSNRP